MTGSDEALDTRLKTLLPEEYQESYETIEPKPMRSAGSKYDADGQVAWDEIWGSFCDLAMAGGPPHKGTLLEPGTEAEIDAQFDRYDEVAEEICRGIRHGHRPAGVRGARPWLGLRHVSRRRDGRLAGARHRHGERRRTPPRRDSRTASGAALPAREGNQERHHRHCEDVSLLAGTHSSTSSSRRLPSCSTRWLRESPLIEPDLASPASPEGPPRARLRASLH